MAGNLKGGLGTIFQALGDGLLALDPSGVIIYANPAAGRLMGRQHNVLVGTPVQSFVDPKCLNVVEERLKETSPAGIGTSGFEISVVREEGGMAALDVRSDPMRTRTGKGGTVWVLRDASFRIRLEEKRAEFFAALTHDIKNALGIIMSSAEILLLKARETDAEQDGRILERMMNNTLTVQTLMTNYLDLSMIESGQLHLTKKAIELNAVLRWVTRQHEVIAERRGITLELLLAPALPAIDGDPVCLERIFANLLHNALKFTPDNGRVTVRSARTDGEIVGEILDTGPGMVADDINLIFEKYGRGSAGGGKEGLGLGLFIVKELAEALGGRVHVDSSPGGGSCFSVFFPIRAGGD